jgi:hypothetical protein
MTRCYVIHFEAILENSCDPINLRIGRYDQMKAPHDEVNVRIDRSCQLGNFVDTRMRTTDNDD